MRKRRVGLAEVIAFAAGRQVVDSIEYYTPEWGLVDGIYDVVGRDPDDFSLVRFTDASAVAVLTTHRGPYSDLTPDVDIETSVYIVTDWPSSRTATDPTEEA